MNDLDKSLESTIREISEDIIRPERTFRLNATELLECSRSPDILELLASYHDFQEAQAASIGEPIDECVEFHKNRRKELMAEADRIREGWSI